MDTERQEHRKWLVRGHAEASQSLDRTLITLASGALVLSIGFIEKIAPPHPTTKWAAITAWALFGASMISVLFSFLCSTHAHTKMIDAIDNSEAEIREGKLTDYVNYFSAGAFFVGVGFLITFSAYNLLARG